jgi:hypothetical protein
MTEPTSAQDLFKGRHFDQEIIILCVVQMMAERGVLLAHSANKAANPADARVQAIRNGGRDDPLHRTRLQPQTTNRTRNHRSGNLDRGPGRLNLQSLSPGKQHTLNTTYT